MAPVARITSLPMGLRAVQDLDDEMEVNSNTTVTAATQ